MPTINSTFPTQAIAKPPTNYRPTDAGPDPQTPAHRLVPLPHGHTDPDLAFTSYLRVIAIVAVVLIHTAGLTHINDDLRYTPVWWIASVLTLSTKWAVPVFVMVSGALLLKPPADPSVLRFYGKRLSRIGIPLAAWHLVYIILTATILMQTIRPTNLITSFLRGRSHTGLYFFWLILGLYLITPVLWPIISSKSQRFIGITGGTLVALASTHNSTLQFIDFIGTGKNSVPDPTLFTQFVPYVGFFILGYAVRNIVIREFRHFVLLTTLIVALCTEQIWQVTGPYPFGPRIVNLLNAIVPVNYQGWIVGASAVAIFIFIRSVVHLNSRWAQPKTAMRARSIGELSLGVFASHLAILMAFRRNLWPNGATTVLQLMGLCGGTLVGAVVITLLLRRVPFVRRCV